MLRKLLIITCLISTVSVAFAQKDKKSKKAKIAETTAEIDYRALGSPMPGIRVVTADHKVITSKDVQSDKHLFLVMFNPTCDHCQDMAAKIRKDLDSFKNNQFVWMAAPSMPWANMEFFESVTQISKTPMIVGLDSAKVIDRSFTYQNLPQINVYDKDRKLVRIFNGETKMEDLKKFAD